MIRIGLIAVLLLGAPFVAAQDVQGSQTSSEKAAGTVLDTMRFCYYEGQPYSEGAVKAVGNLQLVCMRESNFASHKAAALVWENSGQARGKDALGLIKVK